MVNRSSILFAIVIGLLLAAPFTLQADLAWMAMPFLVYLGIGMIRSPDRARIHLSATRTIEKDSTGAIHISVDIQNLGNFPAAIKVVDSLQQGMKIVDGHLDTSLSLRVGESGKCSYSFQAIRGSFQWKTVAVYAGEPFGLFPTRLDLEAPGLIDVRPEAPRFHLFPLRPERTLHSAGAILAHRGGSGTDFWGVREYHPGDPLQRIDWRRVARYHGNLFTREFEQEEITDIGLILDARRTTDLWVADDSLFEHSVRAAAALSETLIRQGNRVSLLLYGDPVISLYPGYGKHQLNQILTALAQATTRADGSLDSLQYVSARMFPSHSLILILSPLASGDWLLFPRLRSYGYQVVLVSPDPVSFGSRTLPDVPANRLASRLAGIERKLEMARISQLWIPVVDWQVDLPLAPLVAAAFQRLQVHQQGCMG